MRITNIYNIQAVPKYHVHKEGGKYLVYFLPKISYKHRSANASLPICRVLKFQEFFTFYCIAPAVFEIFCSNLEGRLRYKACIISHAK